MKKQLALITILPLLISASQITGNGIHKLFGYLPSPKASEKLRISDKKTCPKAETHPLEEVYDIDSIQAVLLPGEAVFLRVDAIEDDVSPVDFRAPLPAECVDAISTSPKWLQNELELSFRHLPDSIARLCANVILDAPEDEIDEVAFCVAHMSPQALSDDRFDPELLLVNSGFIYRIADSLNYVELLEYGDHESGDWYTTTAYWVVDSTLADTTLLEVPKEIYYWYVVHPKLSDEAPKMRDGTGDYQQRTYGYFWREFLWTDPSPVYSYTAGGYPLLPDWIKMAQVLWIRNDTSLAADRWVTPDNGALDILGEWVSTVMPDPPTSTRPIQPNQIAYYHRGNCGEVQDLLCAAARTALIPDLCVGSLLQDHVWNEFWDDEFPGEFWAEDVWHTYQVDRWGGNTALAPHWGGYDADRGGSKNINNCVAWRGDGYMIDRTPAYTRLCTLIVEVIDAEGNPVPGAEVMITSNSLYDPENPFYTADIRATDKNGRMVVSMGENCPYYYRVDSPIGCNPAPGYVSSFPGLGSGMSEAGSTYTVSVPLSGSLDELPITTLPGASGEKQLLVSFSAPAEYIRGTSPQDCQSGEFAYRSDGGIVSVFVCDSANFTLYRSGEAFEAYQYHSRAECGEFLLNLPTDDVWYVVLSAEETIVNDNLVFATATLGVDLESVSQKELPTKFDVAVFPNPFNSSCQIQISCQRTSFSSLEILDISGRCVAHFPLKVGDNTIKWNAQNEPSGVYFVKASAESGAQVLSKILLVR